MATQDRIIATILLGQGALAVLWGAWTATRTGAPAALGAAHLALAVAGLAAGAGWLRRRWAACPAIVFFGAQAVHVHTPDLYWSFMSVAGLRIHLGWLLKGELALNVFALAMLAWIGARVWGSPRPSTPKPRGGAA